MRNCNFVYDYVVQCATLLLAIGRDRTVKFHDASDFKQIAMLQLSETVDAIQHLKWQMNGKCIAICSKTKLFTYSFVRRGNNWILQSIVALHSEWSFDVRSIALSGCGNFCILCQDQSISIHNVGPELLNEMQIPDDERIVWTKKTEINDSAQFSVNPSIFASWNDRKVVIWNVVGSVIKNGRELWNVIQQQKVSHDSTIAQFSFKFCDARGCDPNCNILSNSTTNSQLFFTYTFAKDFSVYMETIDSLKNFVCCFSVKLELEYPKFYWAYMENYAYLNVGEGKPLKQKENTLYIASLNEGKQIKLWRVSIKCEDKFSVRMEDTRVCLKLQDEMAYSDGSFAESMHFCLWRTHKSSPMTMEILVKRSDEFFASCAVELYQSDGTEISKMKLMRRNWLCAHDTKILALSSHLSLPILATATDKYVSDPSPERYIDLVLFSIDTFAPTMGTFIPCGLVAAARDDEGPILLEWIDSEKVPILLLGYASGKISMFGCYNTEKPSRTAANSINEALETSLCTRWNWRCFAELRTAKSPLLQLCSHALIAESGESLIESCAILALHTDICVWECNFSQLQKHEPIITHLEVPKEHSQFKNRVSALFRGGNSHLNIGTSGPKFESSYFDFFLATNDQAIEFWQCRIDAGNKVEISLKDTCRLPFSGQLNIHRLNAPDIMAVKESNRLAITTDQNTIHILQTESRLGRLAVEGTICCDEHVTIRGLRWCPSRAVLKALLVQLQAEILYYEYSIAERLWLPKLRYVVKCPSWLFDYIPSASTAIIAFCQSDREWKFLSCPSNFDGWSVISPSSAISLPVWHPNAILLTLFGMPARIAAEDMVRATNSPQFFEFKRSLAHVIQVLTVLAQILQDDRSAHASANSGLLLYSDANTLDSSDGRYSAENFEDSDENCAKHLFRGAEFMPLARKVGILLSEEDINVIVSAIDTCLRSMQEKCDSIAYHLFHSLAENQLRQLCQLLIFVKDMQSLPYDISAVADVCGVRYVAIARLCQLLRTSDNVPELPSSAIVLALLSDSQTFMVEQCLHVNEMWNGLRWLWPALWLKDTAAIKRFLERLAKYTYSQTRNVMDVFLFYVALNKTKSLAALASFGKSEESTQLANFLEHDFSQERWSKAAVKNAYSLLSKKRYKCAAAFFLMCHPPRLEEAIRILYSRANDPSLALLIARIVQDSVGTNGLHDYNQESISLVRGVTRDFMQTDLLELCKQKGDKWMQCAVLWWLEEYEEACAVVSDSADMRGSEDLIRLINVTSLPLFKQWVYSQRDAVFISFALRKLSIRRHLIEMEQIDTSDWAVKKAMLGTHHAIKLATVDDIEDAFAYAAYVAERHGLLDCALVGMLQTHYLICAHSRVICEASKAERLEFENVKLYSDTLIENLKKSEPKSIQTKRLRRNSEAYSELMMGASAFDRQVKSVGSLREKYRRRASTAQRSQIASTYSMTSPWLRCQVANIEIRRAACNSFILRLAGYRLARDLAEWIRRLAQPTITPRCHLDYLTNYLLGPLSKQFSIDNKDVLRAALQRLSVCMHDHVAEYCLILFLLQENNALDFWVEHLSRRCLILMRCNDDERSRKLWIDLMKKLLPLLRLYAEGEMDLSKSSAFAITITSGAGGSVLCVNESDYAAAFKILMTLSQWRDAQFLANSNNFAWYLELLNALDSMMRNVKDGKRLIDIKKTAFMANLDTSKTLKIITRLILAIEKIENTCIQIFLDISTKRSVCSSPYDRLLHSCASIGNEISQYLRHLFAITCDTLQDLMDLNSCTHEMYGRKSYKFTSEHWREEMREVIGLDQGSDLLTALQRKPSAALLLESDDRVLFLLQHPKWGVEMTLRRFRADTRVYVQCFILSEAIKCFRKWGIYDKDGSAKTVAFLKRCCRQRKLRLLSCYRKRARNRAESNVHSLPASTSFLHDCELDIQTEQDLPFMFVSPWEVEASQNRNICSASASFLELGRYRFHAEHSVNSYITNTEGMEPNNSERIDCRLLSIISLMSTPVWHNDPLHAISEILSIRHPHSKAYLSEIGMHCQRNACLKALQLRLRYIGKITVRLLEAKDLNLMMPFGYRTYPYAFVQISNSADVPLPELWSISTYRSRIGDHHICPRWGEEHDVFHFRFAIPAHAKNNEDEKQTLDCARAGDTSFPDNKAHLLSYTGPPRAVHCTLYGKHRVFPHPHFGRGLASIDALTPEEPLDLWIPLTRDDHAISAGCVRVKISLEFKITEL